MNPLVSGILPIDKVAGVTSHDVVALVRRHLQADRVGHAGTLDPAAVGVLLILIGEATKLMPYVSDQTKEYVVTVRFGVTTDTQDLEGRRLSEVAVPPFTVGDIERLAKRFVGRIRQVPPMYSAVHHQGRRLYELAREGREVAREPREVVVHSIVVEAVEPPVARLRVVCGKGTYVRALAADIGEAFGCGGVVERIERVRVGAFRRDAAVSSADIAEIPAPTLWSRVMPPESGLSGWSVVDLDAAGARQFVNGQPAATYRTESSPILVRVHESGGPLLGVGELACGSVKPVRVLHADRPGARVLPA